jgi:hypothetical protein
MAGQEPEDVRSAGPTEQDLAAITIARVGAYAVELQDLFDRILTLSTAAIALIATFAEKFSGGNVWLGATALIAFAFTIVGCLSVRAAVATWKLAYVGTAGSPLPPHTPSIAQGQLVEAVRQAPSDDPATQQEISRLDTYEAAVEAKHDLVGVMISKLTRWLAASIGLALCAFVTALGFLTAFAVSALT